MSAQRAKVMKFKDGYMISTGEPKNLYITVAKRNVLMKQGVMGLQVEEKFQKQNRFKILDFNQYLKCFIIWSLKWICSRLLKAASQCENFEKEMEARDDKIEQYEHSNFY